MSRRHNRSDKIEELIRVEENILHVEEEILSELRRPLTPRAIRFKETSIMLPADPGNTLVFTGTLTPAGSVFPTGTTFSVTSSDPTVSPTVDPTGLIVTVPLPATLTPGETLTISYTASGITPEPADAPTSISGTIPLTIGAAAPPANPSPTGITFTQTT